jgi:hypothetical protein
MTIRSIPRYDAATGAHTVFIAQPEPSPSSLGFVSLLGVAFSTDTGALGDQLDTNTPARCRATTSPAAWRSIAATGCSSPASTG